MRFNNVVVALTLLVIGVWQMAYAQDSDMAQLRVELEAMLETDQLYRKDMRAVADKFGQNSAESVALWQKQSVLDEANIRRLSEIVQSKGWPKPSIFGWKAASAAFSVVQHSTLLDQQRFLPLVREAAANGDVRPQNLAILEDRVRMREGRPQTYGSQMVVDPDTRRHRFHTIEDEVNVDQRRAAVGLEPLAEYAKRLGFVYELPKP